MQARQAKPRAQLLKAVPKITTLLRRPLEQKKHRVGDQIFSRIPKNIQDEQKHPSKLHRDCFIFSLSPSLFDQINIAPEKLPSFKRKGLPLNHSQGRAVKLHGCMIFTPPLSMLSPSARPYAKYCFARKHCRPRRSQGYGAGEVKRWDFPEAPLDICAMVKSRVLLGINSSHHLIGILISWGPI